MDKKRIFTQLSLRTEGTLSAQTAEYFANNGADGLLLEDSYTSDAEHDHNIGSIKQIVRTVDVPVYVYGGIRRLEDVKKYLYAGAAKAVLDLNRESNRELLTEASARFGKEKIAVYVSAEALEELTSEQLEEAASLLICSAEETDTLADEVSLPVLAVLESREPKDYMALLEKETVCGVTGSLLSEKTADLYGFKDACRKADIPMYALHSAYTWADFKTNSDGMVPVVVQDYRSGEVLMVAYMNEEAYNHTIATGKMTYWSRSRNELWVKGDTSGHYQYVKSLTLDCDMDTILAKVHQIGAACHTGSYSCFFNEAAKAEGQSGHNPLKVLEEVYATITDRKEHPKEGSYTNYLFDKGIDKILKKVGEEATEIVIAAKNPDPEEIKYEISDFLYHVSVLMVERGVTWDDITRELAQR